MKTSWTNLKNIISSTPKRTGLYLSVMDEDGIISCANANMLRNLELENPREVKTNFFDLLHPAHIDDFKKIVQLPCIREKQPWSCTLRMAIIIL